MYSVVISVLSTFPEHERHQNHFIFRGGEYDMTVDLEMYFIKTTPTKY